MLVVWLSVKHCVHFWLDPKIDKKGQASVQASPDVHFNAAKILKGPAGSSQWLGLSKRKAMDCQSVQLRDLQTVRIFPSNGDAAFSAWSLVGRFVSVPIRAAHLARPRNSASRSVEALETRCDYTTPEPISRTPPLLHDHTRF